MGSSMRIGDPFFTSVSREADINSIKWKPSARSGRRSVLKRNVKESSTGDVAFAPMKREGSITSKWKPSTQKRRNSSSLKHNLEHNASQLQNIDDTSDEDILITNEEFHEV